MLPSLAVPGLFVTGTDTGVGKTAVSCALLRVWRAQGLSVTPFKPLVSGRSADGTFEDIERLRAASGLALTDAQVSPLRFEPPLAPAVAAEKADAAMDWRPVSDRINALNAAKTPVLVEGVGGLLAPLDGPHYAIRELIRDLRLPVLVVARAGLGTLNHTAMTVELLKASGAALCGIVMNGAVDPAAAQDNRRWMEKMTGVKVLAVVPQGAEAPMDGALAQAAGELRPSR